MTIQYFDALAGAGKTHALVKYADELARKDEKVLFVQPSKLLITNTIKDEVDRLNPFYPVKAIHGDTFFNHLPFKFVSQFLLFYFNLFNAVHSLLL